jgi:hypothetical protein
MRYTYERDVSAINQFFDDDKLDIFQVIVYTTTPSFLSIIPTMEI